MPHHLSAVVHELRGEPTLGRVLANDHDMRDAIREGFPPAVIERLMQASGLTLKELAASLDLSPRSLQRRRSGGRLAPFESDRLYRRGRLAALAQGTLGRPQPAVPLRQQPKRALGRGATAPPLVTESRDPP